MSIEDVQILPSESTADTPARAGGGGGLWIETTRECGHGGHGVHGVPGC